MANFYIDVLLHWERGWV